MIHAFEIRQIINEHIPKNHWISLKNIYLCIERHGDLEIDDTKSSAPGNLEPKWKRNIRNVLQTDKQAGIILWAKAGAEYMIPEFPVPKTI